VPTATEEEAFNQRKARTLSLVEELNLHSRLPPSTRDRVIFSKLSGLINHALISPWWQERLEPYLGDVSTSKNLSQLVQSLPVLSRQDLQEYSKWMQIWVPGSAETDYVQLSTSGSTGKPVAVTKFKPSQNIQYMATELLDCLWQGLDLSKPILAATSRTPPKLNPAPIGEPHNYLGSVALLHSVKVENQPIKEVLDLMKRENIASALLSPQVLRNLLGQVSPDEYGTFPIQTILAFADRVDASLRERTRKVFGARILDRYSTTECGLIGIQCPEHEHLHPLQFENYVEIVDENNLPSPAGQPGRVLVTSLSSFAMPLIRYEIGDVASWDAPCESDVTLPVLRPEIVRMRETFVGGNGAIFNVLPDNGSFARDPRVKDFQLFIFSNKIVLLLVGDLAPTAPELQGFAEELVQITGKSLPTEVRVYPSVGWLHSWKRRSVVMVNEEFHDDATLENLQRYI
jgi:phenylacetate-CoA ligase